jgi:hypothetical protein
MSGSARTPGGAGAGGPGSPPGRGRAADVGSPASPRAARALRRGRSARGDGEWGASGGAKAEGGEGAAEAGVVDVDPTASLLTTAGAEERPLGEQSAQELLRAVRKLSRDILAARTERRAARRAMRRVVVEQYRLHAASRTAREELEEAERERLSGLEDSSLARMRAAVSAATAERDRLTEQAEVARREVQRLRERHDRALFARVGASEMLSRLESRRAHILACAAARVAGVERDAAPGSSAEEPAPPTPAADEGPEGPDGRAAPADAAADDAQGGGGAADDRAAAQAAAAEGDEDDVGRSAAEEDGAGTRLGGRRAGARPVPPQLLRGSSSPVLLRAGPREDAVAASLPSGGGLVKQPSQSQLVRVQKRRAAVAKLRRGKDDDDAAGGDADTEGDAPLQGPGAGAGAGAGGATATAAAAAAAASAGAAPTFDLVAGWDEQATRAADLLLECIELATRSLEETNEIASHVAQVVRHAFEAGVVDEFGQTVVGAAASSSASGGGGSGGGVSRAEAADVPDALQPPLLAASASAVAVVEEPWWKEEARRVLFLFHSTRDTLRRWEDATRKASAALPALTPRQGVALTVDDAVWAAKIDPAVRPDVAALRALLVLHREAMLTQRARIDEQATRFHDVAVLAK